MLSAPNEDDYYDELILNAHSGMLHDKHRHEAYNAAITSAVKCKKRAGEEVRVLDIGTGTGILSMFAYQAGADEVVACESSEVMCSVARNTFIKNSAGNSKNGPQITIENTFSNCLNERNPKYNNYFNIIISEVYDSFLIGEGCLQTFKHALQDLASPDCIFIPLSATIYIQPFSSEFVRLCCSDHHGEFIKPLEPWETQVGKIDDIITKAPIKLHTWTFNRSEISNWVMDREVKIKWDESVSCVGVVLWWESYLDDESVICTAPSFSVRYQEFRDHWMPIIYFLPPQDEDFSIRAQNDLFSVRINCLHENPQVGNTFLLNRHIAITNLSSKHFVTAITDLVANNFKSFALKYKGCTHLKDAIVDKLNNQYHSISFLEPNSNAEYEIEILDCFDVFSLTQLEFFLKRREYERKVARSELMVIPRQTMLYVQLSESQQLYNKSIPPLRVEGVDISDYHDTLKQLAIHKIHGYNKLDPIYGWEYDYKELSSSVLVDPEECASEVTLTIPVSASGMLTNIFFSVGFKFTESVRLLPGEYFAKIDSLLIPNCFNVKPGDVVILTLLFQSNLLRDITVKVL